MKFGKTEHPELIDFRLPADQSGTDKILKTSKKAENVHIYVGCAKWNRQDLKGFYPRGTKDELTYYATQFNSIELNATFYDRFTAEQAQIWHDKTPENFRFFPKLSQSISHYKRLKDVQPVVEEFCNRISPLHPKTGMMFLQMHDNFGYKDFERLLTFVENFPKEFPLAIELRNTHWYNDENISSELYSLFEANQTTNIITDTAGRRDLLHMRLTTPTAFVRYVGANHESDYSRLDDWLDRLETWLNQGLKNLYFFVHQNLEKESPLLSAYFIKKLNKRFGVNLKIPDGYTQQSKLDF